MDRFPNFPSSSSKDPEYAGVLFLYRSLAGIAEEIFILRKEYDLGSFLRQDSGEP